MFKLKKLRTWIAAFALLATFLGALEHEDLILQGGQEDSGPLSNAVSALDCPTEADGDSGTESTYRATKQLICTTPVLVLREWMRFDLATKSRLQPFARLLPAISIRRIGIVALRL